jgi:hypothetical protein
MPQRQDYILRLLEELNQFLAEVARFRRAGSYDAALLTLLQAQERLFARPAEQFMALPVEDQVRLLAMDESTANARDKCVAYAALLAVAGHIYQARAQPALAHGAYQLASHVTLLALRQFSPPESSAERARIAALLGQLPPDDLTADAKTWLMQLDGKS